MCVGQGREAGKVNGGGRDRVAVMAGRARR